MMMDSILDLTRRINEIDGARASVSIVLNFNAPRCFLLSPSVVQGLTQDFDFDHQVAPQPLGCHSSTTRHPDWHKHTVTLRFRGG